MGRVVTAFRAFFAALANRETADRVEAALAGQGSPAVERPVALPIPAEAPRVVIPPPKQNAAITLLATLQREARLVDFLKEDLDAYSDEQVGAAVREIHRESRSVLDRLFSIRPILSEDEGALVSIPTGFDAARYRLTGRLSGDGPYRGTLRHHGWQTTQCAVPEFVGNDADAHLITPAEVEVQ